MSESLPRRLAGAALPAARIEADLAAALDESPGAGPDNSKRLRRGDAGAFVVGDVLAVLRTGRDIRAFLDEAPRRDSFLVAPPLPW